MPEERILLRTSERVLYKACRQAWWWAYVEKRQSRNPSKPLTFGGLVHQALAPYYKPGRIRGPHPSKTFEVIYKQALEDGMVIRNEEGEWEEALDLGIAMLDGYVERWGGDSDWEVLWSECPAEIDITYARSRRYLVTYVCGFDSLFRDHGKNRQLGLLETKTAAAIDTSHLSLDEQAGSYWAIAPLWLRSLGVLQPGKDVDFILYNFLRKSKPDLRPKNDKGQSLNRDGSVSKKQPTSNFHRQRIYRSEVDRQNLLTRIRMEAWEMAQVRAGKLPVYKNPRGSYPDQHCKGCPFKDPCELHETGGAWEEMLDQVTEPWDPYADYRDPILDL